jgi:hypothetical protein
MRLLAFGRAALEDGLPFRNPSAKEEIRREQGAEEHPFRRDEEDAGPHRVRKATGLGFEPGLIEWKAVARALAATADDGTILSA